MSAAGESTAVPAEPSEGVRPNMFVGGGDHEIRILNSDLNYRMDMHPYSVISREKQGDLPELLERDQLLMEGRRNPGFRLRAFQEFQINFPATYKHDVGTDIYVSLDKKRPLAWLWGARASDHRSASDCFLIRLKTVHQELCGRVREWYQRRYSEIRERGVWRAKLDFLVNNAVHRPIRAIQPSSTQVEIL